MEEENEIVQANKKSTVVQLVPFIGVIVLGLLAFGGYWYSTHTTVEEAIVEMNEETTQETKQDPEPHYTIEEVPFTIADIAPDYNRSIEFGETVPEEARTILEEKAADIRARLAEDISRADDWFELALAYHTANDYKGAEEVWLFLIQVIPDNTTAFDNLGKLYHFSLMEYAKSEEYFNKSLTIDPDNINAYLELYDLYRYSYKTETTAAADIIKKAIAQFPDRLDLVLTLGTYYAGVGNYTEARAVLQEGLDQARDNADLNMITAFGKEIERLPQ